MWPGPRSADRLRHEVRGLLTALVSVGLLAGVASQVDLAGAAARIREVRPGPFLLAVALGPVQVTLSAVRWRMVSEKLDAPLPGRTAVAEYALSTLLNLVLPGGVGGDVLRTWRTHRKLEVPGKIAIQATLIERGIGQSILIAITLGGLVAWPVLLPGLARPGGVLPVVAVLAVVLAGIVAAPTPLSAQIRRALRGMVLPHFLLSSAIVGSYIAGLALCAVALSAPVGAVVFTVFPLILLAMSLPISVGGWGLRETAAVALLPMLGWSGEGALAVAGLYGLSTLIGALPGAVVLLRPVAAWERST
ncbi:MAG: uncharacterized membrane protein YbhN (UPF0104 family) [Myxococcota bacterium]|jgi:uncharacterized membrane protein YbhN (UPF0104 family)